jgi:hypothetical protein
VDVLSPNRKGIDDVQEVGDKAAWTSMVGGAAFQDIHTRHSTNGSGNKGGKKDYEDAFAEAIGKRLPQESRDIRSVNARRSSWGRNLEISPDVLGLSSSNGAEGSKG